VRFEKIFPGDRISKRERVELTLRLESVDRVALHDQLSYNPGVIARYAGREIRGFEYGLEDIGRSIRSTLDMTFPLVTPQGTETVTDEDGFVSRRDNWTSWHVSRPFTETEGARVWLRRLIARKRGLAAAFDPAVEQDGYRVELRSRQALIGETVLCLFSGTGFCEVFDRMGLELYTYVSEESPELIAEHMEVSTALEERRIHAVADRSLSPVILIPEDFATKQGPIFSPGYLRAHHYPYVARLVDAWHEHGYVVLYHSDGNYREAVPDLIASGVDGFYCLEPACGMEVVGLKGEWPEMVWAGGVDGVDLMERGTPEAVRKEVRRQILETRALETGGLFIASSSEINPPIPAENYVAMVEAAGELWNASFVPSGQGGQA
jgi:hypothetical protein